MNIRCSCGAFSCAAAKNRMSEFTLKFCKPYSFMHVSTRLCNHSGNQYNYPSCYRYTFSDERYLQWGGGRGEGSSLNCQLLLIGCKEPADFRPLCVVTLSNDCTVTSYQTFQRYFKSQTLFDFFTTIFTKCWIIS